MSVDGPVQATLGIARTGAYVPRPYLPVSAYRETWDKGGAPGVSRAAVADVDEGTLVMATEAGRCTLHAAGVGANGIDHLALATTTLPNDKEEIAVRPASLLGADPSVPTRQFGGSTRIDVMALVVIIEAMRNVGDDASSPRSAVVTDNL